LFQIVCLSGHGSLCGQLGRRNIWLEAQALRNCPVAHFGWEIIPWTARATDALQAFFQPEMDELVLVVVISPEGGIASDNWFQ